MWKFAQAASGSLRRAIAVMALAAFFATAFGHIYHHSVIASDTAAVYTTANPSAPDESELPNGIALCGHHCTTCVGIILPQTLGAEAVDTLADLNFSALVVALNAHRLALQTPPPKSLT